MQAIELNLKEGIDSLRLNPLRSFLAMLGVVIGVAAVITVISFGASLAISSNKAKPVITAKFGFSNLFLIRYNLFYLYQ